MTVNIQSVYILTYVHSKLELTTPSHQINLSSFIGLYYGVTFRLRDFLHHVCVCIILAVYFIFIRFIICMYFFTLMNKVFFNLMGFYDSLKLFVLKIRKNS